ncbi:MAG TPA: HAMP domain-containing sensor histidine kinase [Candidatus Limnocylindrales bacterium]|jgi:signal transduction histidine kinase
MRRPAWSLGIGGQIALAAIATTGVAVTIVTLGVVVVGSDTFTRLMMEHGSSAETAHAMFDESITLVLAIAVGAGLLAAVALAAVLSRRLGRPLENIGAAARRVAAGDYAARVPRGGPEEVASLADSFNQMASSLEAGERQRTELITNAAHELRTPLTNLKGYLEGLRDGIVPADEATFASLSEEVERLVRLAASLDTLSEAGRGATGGEIRPIDLTAAVRVAADLVAPGYERAGVTLDLDLPGRLDAHTDPDAIAQVLGNLLQNAQRYTPSGGRVTVRIEPRPGDALVSVVNTGHGIPDADLPHVFERFYRVDKSRDRAHGGAGIGLAIVRQLVEAGGGRVGVESGGGLTRFWFSLPT